MPDGIEFVVVHSGQERTLAGLGLRRATRRVRGRRVDRRARCASPPSADVGRIDDPVLRRRARHVVTENQRVGTPPLPSTPATAPRLGALFDASHASLRDDFESSTPVVDATVARLRSQPGVHGVRMTGGGWGGCVVAVTDPGALDEGWVVRPGRARRAA